MSIGSVTGVFKPHLQSFKAHKSPPNPTTIGYPPFVLVLCGQVFSNLSTENTVYYPEYKLRHSGDTDLVTPSPDIPEQEIREKCGDLLSPAAEEARKLGHNYIGTEHLFIAATRR
ncbi:MAG: Clp protease N-terminal domain-containing protein, partial [Anaerolineae bacterium]|nr:Clp protease N-terminal domain-containing protein [Anaerolineae bacterium]